MLVVCASHNDYYDDHDDHDDHDDYDGLMVVWSADIIIFHCPTHVVGLALFDTHLFLLNEYLIELNTTNF